jgi:hypothetical protein
MRRLRGVQPVVFRVDGATEHPAQKLLSAARSAASNTTLEDDLHAVIVAATWRGRSAQIVGHGQVSHLGGGMSHLPGFVRQRRT